MPSALLLAWLALALPHPAPPALDALARAFVQSLASDQPRRLAALAEHVDVMEGTWTDALDVQGRFERLSVRAIGTPTARRYGGAELVTLEIEGSGSQLGEAAHRLPLPRWWTLEAVRVGQEWRLRSVSTLEHRLGYALATSGADELRAALADPRLDRARFLAWLGDGASAAGTTGEHVVRWVLEESRRNGDRVSESVALRMLSYMANAGTLQGSAVELGRQALAAAEASGDQAAIAASQFSIAIAQWFGGDTDAALSTFATASRPIAGADPRTALKAQYMLGLVALRAGKLRIAAEADEALRSMLLRYPWPQGQRDEAFLSGDIYREIGDTDGALGAYRRAFASASDLAQDWTAAMALGEMAATHLQRGELDLARQLLERTIRVQSANDGSAANALKDAALGYYRQQLATSLLASGELAAAETETQRALDVAAVVDDRHLRALALQTRSELRRRQRRLHEALADAESACLEAAGEQGTNRSVGDVPLWSLSTTKARALRALGHSEDAAAAFRAAIDDVESRRELAAADPLSRAAYLDDKTAPYRELTDLLAAAGDPRGALAMAERMRAESLRRQLERGHVDLSSALTATEMQREQELEGRLSELNRSVVASTDPALALRARLDAARSELERFRAELYLRHPSRATPPLPPANPLRDAADALPAGSAAVELLMLDREVLAFVVVRGATGVEVSVHRLPLTSIALAHRIDAFDRSLSRRDLVYEAEASALHRMLVTPLLPALHGVRTLYLVPDGPLWRLPFHALRGSDGRFLVERMAVAYAPSLDALALDRRLRERRPAPTGSLLALADPDLASVTARGARAVYRGLALGRLPDASREVRAIAALYPGAQVAVGREALESLFKREAPHFRVLHLAAHGLVDDGAPLFSSVVLAASADDDGLLEVREILELPLRADLAVLSACDTARGRIGAGEGVIGLSWAFQAAGVPTTVVSQWQAESKATAALMLHFHHHLVAGASPASALRQAQLELMRQPRYRHPFYWAPFVVVGVGE